MPVPAVFRSAATRDGRARPLTLAVRQRLPLRADRRAAGALGIAPVIALARSETFVSRALAGFHTDGVEHDVDRRHGASHCLHVVLDGLLVQRIHVRRLSRSARV